MNENTALTEVKTAMLLHCPFFASIMLDHMTIKVGKYPEVFGSREPTAATDGKNMWFDEDSFATMKLPERVFVTAHEISHAMWQHMARAKQYLDTGFDGKPFDQGRYNRAGDYVINDMLVNCKIGKMPDCGLHDPSKYTSDMLVDDVYRLLEDDPNDGDGPGPGEGGTLDHHVPAPTATTEAEMKRVIASAADAAKSQGKLPADLERFVDQILEPKVAWTELLRKAMQRCAGRDAVTYTKPHRRRLITQGLILPSYTGYASGDIVFVMDTSGSMGQKEMAQGLGECDNILQDCMPKSVTLIGCDARVNSVNYLYSGDSLKDNPPKLGGGGGTSFKPPFEFVEEEGINPATLVYFTDMYGDFPEDPGYPVIWCSSSEGMEGPFGETIFVEFD
jgi:predicted metal-dependent peptidase